MKDLSLIRKQIEEIDRHVVRLLDERMRLVEELSALKMRKGIPLRDLEREKDLLEALLKVDRKYLRPEELKAFYRTVFIQSFFRQKSKLRGTFGPFPICVSVVSRSAGEAEKIIHSLLGRAEMVELRIDTMRDGLPDLPDGVPLVLTNRKRDEGGEFSGSEEERIKRLEEAIDALKPTYVDVEASTPEPYVERVIRSGVKVILSHHDLSGTPSPSELLDRLKGMQREGVEVYKIVTIARSLGDSAKVLAFLAEAAGRGFNVVGHAMGKEGRISRVMSPYFGASFVYAAPESGMEAAPGQMTPEELREAWLLLGKWL